MKRRLLTYLSLIIALVLASLAVLFFGPGDQINPQNIAKIKPGMPERDVEEILGGRGQFLLKNARAWGGADWTATVCFDDNGLVLTTMFGPQETFLARVRRWLGLQTRLPALDLWDGNMP
jgi:hypothetical protein